MGTSSGYLMLYDYRYNALQQSYLHSRKGAFTSLSMFKRDRSLPVLDHISPSSGPLLLTASDSGEFEVAMWDLVSGRCKLLLSLQSDSVTVPCLAHDNMRLAELAPEAQDLSKSAFSSNLRLQKAATQRCSLIADKISGTFERWSQFGSKPKDTVVARKVLCPMVGGTSMPYIVTGSSDAIVRYWDLRNPRSSKFVAMQDFMSSYNDNLVDDAWVVQEIENCAKHSNSPQFSQFSSIGMLRSVDNDDLFVTRKYLHTDDINDLALVQGTSPYLVSGSRDGSIRLWR